MEREFIAGGIETPAVRRLLDGGTTDEKTLPALAICGNAAPEHVAAALYLPQSVYEQEIPVFVYQREPAAILDIPAARAATTTRSA